MTAALLKFFGGIVAAVLAVTLGGWALSTMWTWFVVPVFHLPVLSWPQAIGLSLTLSYVTHQVQRDDVPFATAVGAALLKPPLAVGIGWIVARFL